jgi:hypothetical protein
MNVKDRTPENTHDHYLLRLRRLSAHHRAKNTFAWGFGRYKFQHEPLFYAHVAGEKDPWYGDKSQSTLWQEKKPAANRIHPTAKPVELIERALLNSSKTAKSRWGKKVIT